MTQEHLQLQLVAFEPQGTDVKAILPFPKSFTATSVRNKIAEGALELEYDKNTIGYEWLLKPCEIAVRANIGSVGNYGELVGQRYLAMDDRTDLIARAGDDATIRTNAQPIGWLFSTALVYPLSGQSEANRPYRRFKAQTVGQVWNVLMSEAQGLGCLQGITKNWTNTNDSNGVAWGATYNWTFNVGDTLLDVINKMCEDGRCDAIMAGRQFRLYKPGTLGDIGNNSILRIGGELISAPREVDRSKRRSHALAVGQRSIYVHAVNPNLATTEWGNWYTLLNIDDDKTTDIQNKAKSQLQPLAPISYSLTAGLSLKPQGKLPYHDYKLGDWVGIATSLLTPTESADPTTRFQVERITMRSDQNGVLLGELELGKRRKRPTPKTATKLAALEAAVRPLVAPQRGGSTTNEGDKIGRVVFTSTQNIAAGAEAQVGLLSSMVWSEGRVYECVVKRAFTLAANGRMHMQVRSGSSAGATIWSLYMQDINAAAQVRYDVSFKWRRQAGLGDLTRSLSLVAVSQAGAITALGNSSDQFGEFYVIDIGPEFEWPDVPVIT